MHRTETKGEEEASWVQVKKVGGEGIKWESGNYKNVLILIFFLSFLHKKNSVNVQDDYYK